MLQEEKRNLTDRRRKPTPGLSRYTIWGHRKGFRRKEDRLRGGYVDRYESGFFVLLMAIVVLNVADAFLTTIILDSGGHEVNPIVQGAISMFGYHFWIWKFLIVSVAVVMLCLLSQIRRVKSLVAMTALLYFGIVMYQIYLINNVLPGSP